MSLEGRESPRPTEKVKLWLDDISHHSNGTVMKDIIHFRPADQEPVMAIEQSLGPTLARKEGSTDYTTIMRDFQKVNCLISRVL
jgi:hypothetical protein